MRFIFSLLGLFFYLGVLTAQVEGRWYLVSFKDKQNTTYSVSKPEAFLSKRAIARRARYNIAIDSTDMPVNQSYIDSLKTYGFTVKYSLKWANAATILVSDTLQLSKLQHKMFIKSWKYCGTFSGNSNARFLDTEENNTAPHTKSKLVSFDYGQATAQTVQCNGNILHNKGFTGRGMWIAVLDGGFYKANTFPAFDSLWVQNRIIGTRDFVRSDENFFETHSHGMSVLSIMSGNISGSLIGSCPHASYLLVRTEDTESESPVEECNWMAGAEYADSLGIDVINSSLGYARFDDKSLNHKYAEFDGKTTLISKAAGMASAKGMLVVLSAGNERNGDWKYISTPADAINVLTVGAVDSKGRIASFSSAGPTFDKRIKPDVVGMGYLTALQNSEGNVSTGSGTSFSSPLIAGFSACLWQALPELTVNEVIALIRGTASKANAPDSLYGYGIPDFDKALAHGQQLLSMRADKKNEVICSPSPFDNYFNLLFRDTAHTFQSYELISINGQKVTRGKIQPAVSFQEVSNAEFAKLHTGVYILCIKDKSGREIMLKVIHL
jgi:subtilisin family serine protease